MNANIQTISLSINSGISRAFYDEPKGIPVLRSNNVQNGEVRIEGLKYWHESDPQGAKYTDVIPKVGDILVNFVNGSQTELGKAGVYRGIPTRCLVSTNFFIVRLKKELVHVDYMKYIFQSNIYKKWLYQSAGFTGQGSFNKSDFGKFTFNLPSLNEQAFINELLSTWDTAIETMEKLIVAKEKAFSNLLDSFTFRNRRTDWSEVHLGEAFSERNETCRDDLPLLSISRDDGITAREETNRKDTSNEDKSKYLRVCPGDIGYNTMRMWQGVSALSQLEGIVSPAYTVCIPNKDVIDGSFASYLFKHPQVIHQFYRHSQGLTSDTWNLKFKHFSEIKLWIPPLMQQRKIAENLALAQKEMSLLKAQLAAIQLQKRALMQKLLTGEWRIRAEIVKQYEGE
jgi:type I restriction enzyme S subunit